MNPVSGFSKMSKAEKIAWLASQFEGAEAAEILAMGRFWDQAKDEQRRFDEFAENTLTNYYLPFGVAPNFLINGKTYTVPMVIEESSVVAAASLAAKFWQTRGGFHTRIISTTKVGQVHFLWQGSKLRLESFFDSIKNELRAELHGLTANMEARGGGLGKIELVNRSAELENLWQIRMEFETCDAMGANFINSVLEETARLFKGKLAATDLPESERVANVIMCILSNYTPDCVVEAYVECPIDELGSFAGGMSARTFAERFRTGVEIARIDTARAVTHNKGIMNGVDAVVLATGNDFRAVEACAHAFAARDGQYRSLSSCTLEDDKFRFTLRIPLALGTVGGLTKLHPLAKISLSILGGPSAAELMQVAVATGLAQNFAAVRSLVTTGIQKGHMKLHLLNILTQLNASDELKEAAKSYFADKVVSYTAVRNFVQSQTTQQQRDHQCATSNSMGTANFS